MIYFDNAATTLQKPETVAKAVAEAISNLGNAGRGAYDAALHSMRMAYETREMINEFFNGDGPEQVAFMSNATEALNTAINGILQPGDHVITTAMEHNSVLRPLYLKEQQGVASLFFQSEKTEQFQVRHLRRRFGQIQRLSCVHMLLM